MSKQTELAQVADTITVDSGNVGIGTSSPSLATASGSATGLEISGSVPAINLNAGSSDEFLIYGGSSNANILVANNNPLRFLVGGSEAMRIDSSGNLLVGKTSAADSTDGIWIDGGGRLFSTNTSDYAAQFRRNGTDGIVVYFLNDAALAGNISVSGSTTAYNTSSDYRLKTDVQSMTGATNRLQQLNPVNFEWIAEGTRVDGFLAHEVQDIVPEAIIGTHNEVDADGNPVYQGIDQSKLVPLLVATIKELEARITALENA